MGNDFTLELYCSYNTSLSLRTMCSKTTLCTAMVWDLSENLWENGRSHIGHANWAAVPHRYFRCLYRLHLCKYVRLHLGQTYLLFSSLLNDSQITLCRGLYSPPKLYRKRNQIRWISTILKYEFTKLMAYRKQYLNAQASITPPELTWALQNDRWNTLFSGDYILKVIVSDMRSSLTKNLMWGPKNMNKYVKSNMQYLTLFN